jgi:hypothetical protein
MLQQRNRKTSYRRNPQKKELHFETGLESKRATRREPVTHKYATNVLKKRRGRKKNMQIYTAVGDMLYGKMAPAPAPSLAHHL